MQLEKQPIISKDNLDKTNKQLKAGQEGAKILDQVVNRLMAVIIPQVIDYAAKDEQKSRLFNEAYAALEKAQLIMGVEAVDFAALSARKDNSIGIKEIGVMGVPVPEIRFESQAQPESPPYSPGGSSVVLDEARQAWLKVLETLPIEGEKAGILRMAFRLTKVRRLLNSLKEIKIPRLLKDKAIIMAQLEQQALEETVRTRLIKKRIEKKKREKRQEMLDHYTP